MTDRRQHAQLLIQAGRLLLEYNESTRGIIETLTSTAKILTAAPCHVAVSYRSIAISLGDESPVLATVKELRLNAAVHTRIHEVLEQVRCGRIDAAQALVRLSRVEADSPRHARWLVALLLGGAACGFAKLLGADAGAVGIAGAATALGLPARQELARRHASLLAPPFAAALIGALLGGIAIRLGWTQTPELALVVPALMIVPGPHFLNGLLDLADNHLSMSLSRLGLAMGVLLASALGLAIGIRCVFLRADFPDQPASTIQLTLAADILLAGIATCGFAAFFNTPWRRLWMATVGGMAGHGLRFMALQSGCEPEIAAFFGGLVVGAVSNWLARPSHAPVAVIAFAGAVTMIPGSSFYQALGGALRLARQAGDSNPALAAGTLGHAMQGCVVVCGLALGLVLGIRLVEWILGSRVPPD
jgi:uncharacterized membrane protein YjjP (DUF1212 family)